MDRVIDSIVEEALRELADEAFQRRVWVGLSPGEMSSFTECVEHLFDDSGLGDALDSEAVIYSAEVNRRFQELDVVLASIQGHDRSPNEVIDDPAMVDARRLASAILKAVRDLG